MKRVKTMRMLLSGKPQKQPRQKKRHRPLKLLLMGMAVGKLLDLLEGKWNSDLWKPNI